MLLFMISVHPVFLELAKYQMKNFFFLFFLFFSPPLTNVQLAKSLTASFPAQDKKIIIMRIIGHISYFSLYTVECDSGSFEGKETAVLAGYGSLCLEEITAQKCLF